MSEVTNKPQAPDCVALMLNFEAIEDAIESDRRFQDGECPSCGTGEPYLVPDLRLQSGNMVFRALLCEDCGASHVEYLASRRPPPQMRELSRRVQEFWRDHCEQR